jgi:hypothetical protein
MKRLFIILLMSTYPLFFDTKCLAREHANIGGLHPDKLHVLSPDGKFELWNEDDIFVINPRGVDGVFFSDDIPQLQSSITFNALYATWSPNSNMIAVCVRTAKLVEDTFVLALQGQDGWRYITLPYNDPEAWAIPLRWLDPDTLVVEISGPRRTKSEDDPDFYVYTMIVRYDKEKDKFIKVSETKRSYPERDHD